MNSASYSFDSHFEVVLADTPDSKAIHYNLRYRVYCDEMGYEDKDACFDQLEFDEWDRHAVHFLVRHKFTRQWLGGLRLVYHREKGLPFQKWCRLDQNISTAQYANSVELSRLCVIKEARRYVFNASVFSDEGRTAKSNIRLFSDYKKHSLSMMWGLIRAAAVYSRQNDVDHWYGIVAPSLACLLVRGGLMMHQLAEPFEHRGKRVPYRLDVDQVLANPLWQHDYKSGFLAYSELEAMSLPKIQPGFSL